MFIVATDCPYLNPIYDDNLYNNIYFLGYTDEIFIADSYIRNFYSIKDYNFEKIEINEKDLEKIKRLIPKLQEIRIYESIIGNNYFALTDMEEVIIREYMIDDNNEFEDIRSAILNLSRFDDKKINKVKEKLTKILLELESYKKFQNTKYGCVFDVDIVHTLKYYAYKMHLYDASIYKYERCGR